MVKNQGQVTGSELRTFQFVRDKIFDESVVIIPDPLLTFPVMPKAFYGKSTSSLKLYTQKAAAKLKSPCFGSSTVLHSQNLAHAIHTLIPEHYRQH